MSYFHCGNGYPDRCNDYKGPLDASVCTSGRHKYDESGRQILDTNEPTCEHEWTERGTPGDEWRECWLCGKQEDR